MSDDVQNELNELQEMDDLADVNWDEVTPDTDALVAAQEDDAEAPVAKAKKKRGRKKKVVIDPETGEEVVKPPKKTRAESRRYSPEDIREMNRLFYTGMSKNKIAIQFECSAVFIYNVIKQNVYKDVDVSDIVAEFLDESAPADVPSESKDSTDS